MGADRCVLVRWGQGMVEEQRNGTHRVTNGHEQTQIVMHVRGNFQKIYV